MSVLRNMSFNVKPVRDPEESKLTHDERMLRAKENIEVAQAYSELTQEFVLGVTGTIVTGVCAVLVTKGSFDVLKALAGSIGHRK